MKVKTLVLGVLLLFCLFLFSCGKTEHEPVEVVVNGKSYQALYVERHGQYWRIRLIDGTMLYATGEVSTSRIDYGR